MRRGLPISVFPEVRAPFRRTRAPLRGTEPPFRGAGAPFWGAEGPFRGWGSPVSVEMVVTNAIIFRSLYIQDSSKDRQVLEALVGGPRRVEI